MGAQECCPEARRVQEVQEGPEVRAVLGALEALEALEGQEVLEALEALEAGLEGCWVASQAAEPAGEGRAPGESGSPLRESGGSAR